MHVVEKEHPLADAGENRIHAGLIEGTASRGAGKPVHQAALVVLCLQPSNEPGATVGKALVIEVNRILGGQDDAHSERARLLEQGHQRGLGRRIGNRREVAEDLVHVEQCPQAGGAGLTPYPGEGLVEQHGDKEHAFGVTEVGNGEDGDAWLPLRRIEQAADIQRLALHPDREAG